MSWVSTFVHNNRNLIGLLPGGVGSAVNGIFDPKGALQPAQFPVTPGGGSFPPYNYNRLQNPGINPRRRAPVVTSQRDSSGFEIGIPGTIGMKHSIVRQQNYTSAPQQAVTGSAALCGITGYHLAKTPRLRAQGICVKNRHMNFGNGRAVKRAVRRLRGFHKLAVRVEKSLHIGRATSRRRPAASCSHR